MIDKNVIIFLKFLKIKTIFMYVYIWICYKRIKKNNALNSSSSIIIIIY